MGSKNAGKTTNYQEVFNENDSKMVLEDKISSLSNSWRTVFPDGCLQEVRRNLVLAGPLFLCFEAEAVLQPMALMVGGHLGTQDLAALGLANSFIAVFCSSVALGLSTVCDTYFSQILGKNNMEYFGVMLQRSIVIVLLVALLCCTLLLNGEGLLLLLHQEPATAQLAGHYLTLFIAGTPALFWVKMFRSYLVVLGYRTSTTVILVVSLALYIPLNYMLVYHTSLDMMGSSVAQDIAYIGRFLAIVSFIYASKAYQNNWTGWTWKLLNEWKEFLSLSVFGTLLVCLDFLLFELGVILAGLFGDVELAAQSIVFNINFICYPIAGSISAAGTLIIGEALGAGKPEVAKQAAWVALIIGVVVTIFEATVFGAGRYLLPRIYTSDEQVIGLSAELLVIVAIYNIGCNTSIIARGIYGGVAMRLRPCIISFVGYYMLALPIGCCLMFLTSLRTKGLWIGFAVGIMTNTVVYLYEIFFKLDWELLSAQAIQRASKGTSIELHQKSHEKSNDNEETSHLLHSGQNLRPPMKLIVQRVAFVSGILAVVLIGVLCRVFIPIPDPFTPRHNITDIAEDLKNSSQATFPPFQL